MLHWVESDPEGLTETLFTNYGSDAEAMPVLRPLSLRLFGIGSQPSACGPASVRRIRSMDFEDYAFRTSLGSLVCGRFAQFQPAHQSLVPRTCALLDPGRAFDQ